MQTALYTKFVYVSIVDSYQMGQFSKAEVMLLESSLFSENRTVVTPQIDLFDPESNSKNIRNPP